MYRTLRKRPPTGTVVLTERDKAWLRMIHRHRFMTTDQAEMLAGWVDGGANRDAVNDRLRKLYDHDFLDRPEVQIEQSHKEKRHTIHVLGQKGAEWLTKSDGATFPAGKGWASANRELKSFERMAHRIGAADTVLHFVRAIDQHPGLGMVHQLELMAEADWPKKLKPFHLPTEVMRQGERVKRATNPDYTFALTKVVDGVEKRALFFLEYDNATEDFLKSDPITSSIGQKHEGYNDAHSRKLAKDLYGINNFRVLFVINGPLERVAKFQGAFERKVGNERRAGVFLYATLAELEARGPLADIWVDGIGRRTSVA